MSPTRALAVAAAFLLPPALASAIQIDGLPPDLAKALAREAKPLEARPFKTKHGVTGKIESKGAPKVEDDADSSTLTTELGTANPLACEVHPDRVDAAAVVAAMIGRIGQAEGMQIAEARVIAIDEANGRPVIVAEAVYLQSQPGGQKALGHLKIAVSPGDAASFVCYHDELGYSDTVRRAAKALAASLAHPGAEDPRTTAAYAELQVLKIGPVPVGFEERHLTKGEKGRTLEMSLGAELGPTGKPGELAASDSLHAEEADAQGVIVSATYVRGGGGKDRNVKLQRSADGKGYAYEGEVDGKPAKGSFEVPGGLASDVLFAQRLSGAKPPAEAKFQQWVPAADPLAATEVVVRADAKTPGRYQLSVGTMKLAADLDAQGAPKRTEADVGNGMRLVSERVWSRGKR